MTGVAPAPEGFESAARAALAEVTSPDSVGALLLAEHQDEAVMDLEFASTLPGYVGWRWTVSMAQLPDAAPSVLEVELLPGEGALLAPAWVPWTERLAEYRRTHPDEADVIVADEDVLDDEDELDPDEDVLDDEADDELDGIDFEAPGDLDDDDDDDDDDEAADADSDDEDAVDLDDADPDENDDDADDGDPSDDADENDDDELSDYEPVEGAATSNRE
jgi:hypothetical protein